MSVVQQKLNWRDAEEGTDWDVAWLDSSVNITRVMRLRPNQVSSCKLGTRPCYWGYTTPDECKTVLFHSFTSSGAAMQSLLA